MSHILYRLIIIVRFTASQTFGQMSVKHFNAGWNEANGVDWIMDLEDCKTKSYVDIAKDVEAQKKCKIAVVPTIIRFKDGEEVARFQAD